MDTFLQNKEEKRGVNKILLISLAAAVLLISGGIYLWSLQPNMEEQKQKALEGAHLEGSPEFQKYTNNLIVTTDLNRTSQSPIGLGTIQMMLHADVRNRGERAINGLEISASVVDSFNKVLREKKVMVVPNQQERLSPGETMHIAVPIDGFKKDDDRANIRWKITAIRFE